MFIDYAETELPEIHREDIETSTDIDWLKETYTLSLDMYDSIRTRISEGEFANVNDHDWKVRASSKCYHLKMGMKWIERRLFELGDAPDYPASDPRNMQIRALEARVKDLKARLASVAPLSDDDRIML
jgi:hypothetical protein